MPEVNHDIDEIINLKKPRKLKILRMLFEIFSGKFYFTLLVVAIYYLYKYLRNATSIKVVGGLMK